MKVVQLWGVGQCRSEQVVLNILTIENLMTTHSNTRPSAALALWLAAAGLTLTGVAPSHAQQPAGTARTFISINGGLQALTGSFSESVVFPESGGVYREVLSAAAAQEQARLESDYRYRTGPLSMATNRKYCASVSVIVVNPS